MEKELKILKTNVESIGNFLLGAEYQFCLNIIDEYFQYTNTVNGLNLNEKIISADSFEPATPFVTNYWYFINGYCTNRIIIAQPEIMIYRIRKEIQKGLSLHSNMWYKVSNNLQFFLDLPPISHAGYYKLEIVKGKNVSFNNDRKKTISILQKEHNYLFMENINQESK